MTVQCDLEKSFEQYMKSEKEALASIAVSLKCIADALETHNNNKNTRGMNAPR